MPQTADPGSPTVADLLADLGAIDPARVLIVPPPGTATEDDLIRVNGLGLGLFELVDDALVAKGMGYGESAFALALASSLNAVIIPGNLGLLSGAGGMMRLGPNSVRMPDLSFSSWDRIPGRRRPKGPIAGFAPDLAVEVLSRSNTPAEMDRKRREYFAAGVRLVWEVDPDARTVRAFDAARPDHPEVLDASATLDGGAVLPGFALPLADLFGELDRHAAGDDTEDADAH